MNNNIIKSGIVQGCGQKGKRNEIRLYYQLAIWEHLMNYIELLIIVVNLKCQME